MKKAFTLLELLVVIGIMGLLGTASIGGYRAMRRGMEDKGVMQNVNSFIRAAYQRAQVDRQPTAVFFWNETLRGSTVDDNEIVIGKAVAVRRAGRLSRVQGAFLYDEFADLEQTYSTDDEEGGGVNQENSIFLYPMDDIGEIESSTTLRRSTVEGKVYKRPIALSYLSGPENKTLDSGEVHPYAFKLVEQGGVTWEAGMAYGFEFAELKLPHGFIFGQNYSTSLGSPVRDAGSLVFDVGKNDGSGMVSSAGLGNRKSVSVYSLRPDTSGNLKAQKVGDSENPTNQ